MNYNKYTETAEKILNESNPPEPYNDPAFMEYVKLNRSRMKRWETHGILSEGLIEGLKKIKSRQHWIIISEPWCGDAAHIVPFIVKAANQNNLISYDIQLRDAEPFLINNYLTNGSKSIPMLIVRDENNKDMFVWGPRPKAAQLVMEKMKAENADFETIKIALQNWYNKDKGVEICKELSAHFQ
ncbi:MAG: thioredoxin family protein [Ferruginibacter sp.]|nr:thioredoxin family protein [Ferruginibacter sp.]